MPRINEMVESKFLKREDVANNGRGALMTIAAVKQHNVAMQGAGESFKWCLEFAESDKPMVLNVTNMRLIENITGSDDTDVWIGRKIVLYDDPTIMYKGEVTGGIRVRAPRQLASAAPQPAPKLPVPPEVADDDLRF